MKIETVVLPHSQTIVQFLIGKNACENTELLKQSDEDDIWFHAADGVSSCHVVARISHTIDIEDESFIVKKGAELCKNNTNKLKAVKRVPFVYTTVKNVHITKTHGKVELSGDIGRLYV
jgi:predicted ribosome quality control (RQC) complex YloA/Tae2 family protein